MLSASSLSIARPRSGVVRLAQEVSSCTAAPRNETRFSTQINEQQKKSGIGSERKKRVIFSPVKYEDSLSNYNVELVSRLAG